jgi:hypothetical protein
MHRPLKNLIAGLALFALLGAQVFGLQRGYLCLCTGEAVETAATHCEDSEEGCGHEHEDEEAPVEHAPLTVKHEAQGKTSSMQVQAPVLVAVLDFTESFSAWPERQAASGGTAMSRPPPGRFANPPAALLVAECTVRLV